MINYLHIRLILEIYLIFQKKELGTEEATREEPEREREREKQNCGGGREELLSKQTREERCKRERERERDTWRRKLLKRIFAARGVRIYCNLSDT